MLFTFVLTSRGDFDVHRAGCADLSKRRKRGGHFENGRHNIEAVDVKAAVAGEIADLNGDFGDGSWTDEQFHVLPCSATEAK